MTFSHLFFSWFLIAGARCYLLRLKAKTSTEKTYIAYATAYAKPDSKRIRLLQFLITDGEGNLTAEGSGDTTIGFYKGRISPMKIRIAVQSFAKYELKRLNLDGDVPLENVQLKTPVEIEQVLSVLKSERYDRVKDLR